MSKKRRRLPATFSTGGLSRADRRAAGVRVVLEGAAAILEDRGGEDVASHLLRRAAHRVMHLDQMLAQDELRLAKGETIDRTMYLAGAATWLRYAQAIGLSRSARRVKSLAEEMAAIEGAKP